MIDSKLCFLYNILTLRIDKKKENDEMKKALRIVSVLLVLILPIALFAGCKSSDNQNNQSNRNEQTSQDQQSSQPAETAQSSQGTPITLKANNFAPAVLPFGQGLELAKEYIERESNGMVLIETYHDGTLLSFPDTFQGVSQGVADIGIVGPAAIDSVTTLNTIFSVVQKYIPSDPHDTTAACYELLDAMPELQAEMESLGLRWAGMFGQFGSNIHSRGVKIKTPDDMNGVTFQTIGSGADYFTGMGANGLNIDPSEVYVSMERGVFQVDVIHWAALWAYKNIELTDYHLLFGEDGGGLYFGIMGFIINKNSWDKLTPEQQKIVWDGFRLAADYSIDLDANEVNTSIQYAKDNGHEIVYITTPEELAPWHEHVDRFHAEWVKRVTEAGFPTAQATLDKLQELLSKY